VEICPKCQRQLPRANAWHYCAEVEIDSLFEGKKEELTLVFDKILTTIYDWDEIAVSATKNCIVFVRNITFLVIRPMKKQLELKFYLKEHREDHPIYKSEPWNSKFATYIRIGSLDELDSSIFPLIKKSYDIS
jgi:hypothetical protein